jgi:hypothetical protein
MSQLMLADISLKKIAWDCRRLRLCGKLLLQVLTIVSQLLVAKVIHGVARVGCRL